MRFRMGVALLLLALSAAVAAPASAQKGDRQLGFNCTVAQGPRLADCTPLANELPPEAVEALRRRVEATPACQLDGLATGEPAQRAESFSISPKLLTPEYQARPHVLDADWRQRPSAEVLARVYPDRAARDGVEGYVMLSCRVGVSGLTRDCRVLSERPGGSGFGAAALAASASFRFRPAMTDCQPIEGEVRVPLNFVLPERPGWASPLAAGGLLVSMLLGLGVAVMGARALVAAPQRPTQTVELPERAPVGPILCVALGLAITAAGGWLLWNGRASLWSGGMSLAPLLAVSPALLFVPLLGMLAAMGVVNVRLRILGHGSAAKWVDDWTSRGSIFPWTLNGQEWIWSQESRRIGDRLLRTLVTVARVFSLGALVMLVLALSSLAFG